MLCLGHVWGSLLSSLGPLAVGLVPEIEGAEQLGCTMLGTPRATAVVLGKLPELHPAVHRGSRGAKVASSPLYCPSGPHSEEFPPFQQCTGGLVVLRWQPHPSTVPLASTVKNSHPSTFFIHFLYLLKPITIFVRLLFWSLRLGAGRVEFASLAKR